LRGLGAGQQIGQPVKACGVGTGGIGDDQRICASAYQRRPVGRRGGAKGASRIGQDPASQADRATQRVTRRVDHFAPGRGFLSGKLGAPSQQSVKTTIGGNSVLRGRCGNQVRRHVLPRQVIMIILS
jgi:hypothetical protein